MQGLLRVRCRVCRTSFVSAHQGLAADLCRDPLLELTEACPHCGVEAQYAVDDYERGRLVGPCGPLARASG